MKSFIKNIKEVTFEDRANTINAVLIENFITTTGNTRENDKKMIKGEGHEFK